MTAIVYVSNTGSAKTYAEMLSEKTGFSAYDFKDCGSVPEGAEVIFIGWVMAGGVQGLKEAREKFGTLKAVIAVGMMKSEKQLEAVNKIYAAFDKNGIDYLPLKGCNMKYLYPKPELRSMGDADILIREEQYKSIKDIVSPMKNR